MPYFPPLSLEDRWLLAHSLEVEYVLEIPFFKFQVSNVHHLWSCILQGKVVPDQLSGGSLCPTSTYFMFKWGIGIWSFLDKWDHYFVSWCSVMVKFWLCGAFFTIFQGSPIFWPSDLHRSQSSKEAFLVKIQPHINVPIKMLLLCEKITSKT